MSWWSRGGGSDTLRKIAAAITQEYGIGVNFTYGGEATHTDTKKRQISIDLDQAYKHGEDYAIGLLLHEVAHLRYTPTKSPDLGAVGKDKERQQAAFEIYNWLEDRRIDGIMRDEYAGAGEFQDALREPTYDRIGSYLEKVPPQGVEPQDPTVKIYRNALAVATLSAEGRDTTFCEAGDRNLKSLALDKVAPIYKRISKTSTSAEVENAAREVINLLLPYIPPGCGGGNGEGSGEGEDGHDHGMREFGGHGDTPSGGILASPEDYFLFADKRAQARVPLLKKKLIAKLRDTEHEKWESNQRRGRLDKKRLIRIAHKNYRVYRKRLEKKGKKYSFAVLLDTSGSMWDHGASKTNSGERSRIGQAMEATSPLLRSMRGLGVTASLTVYGEEAKTMLLPKEVYNPTTIHRRMMYSDDSVYQSGSNETHKGIKEALKHLQKQQHEKVLVIITDGGLNREDVAESRAMIEKARTKGVHTILYYVEEGSHNHKRILNDPDREKTVRTGAELIPATLELIKSLEV